MREEMKREGDEENREEDKQNVGTYMYVYAVSNRTIAGRPKTN